METDYTEPLHWRKMTGRFEYTATAEALADGEVAQPAAADKVRKGQIDNRIFDSYHGIHSIN